MNAPIKMKAASWQAKAAFKTTDNSCNSNPLTPPTKINLADFPIGFPEFELLENKFTHRKTAVLLQHLEFLNRKFGLPPNGVYRNIYPCRNVPDNKTISGHIGIKSPRLLYAILKEIRVARTFQKGVRLIPSEIDFEGKLYASYRSPSPDHQTVYWYRNEALINQLCADIDKELLDQKQAKKLTFVVPREPLSELSGGTASELSGEPSSEPSYIEEEVEVKKLEAEKYKAKHSLKLVPLLSGKSKTKTSGKSSSHSEKAEVKKSFPIKEDKTSVAKLGAYIYPAYKDYCKSRDGNHLMPDSPTGADALGLGKFAQAFCGLGFKQHELPPFFAMLGSKHDDAALYLEDHGVWQIKNCKVFFNRNILVNEVNHFASWFKKQLDEIAKKAEYKKSIADKHNKSPAIPSPTKPLVLKSLGFTYEAHMAGLPENERESIEYLFVLHERFMPEMCLAGAYRHRIDKESMDLPASEERIKSLRALSPEELEQLPFPR